jgi:dynein intermediate chain
MSLISSTSSRNCSSFLRRSVSGWVHHHRILLTPRTQERVLYNKEIQTSSIETETTPDGSDDDERDRFQRDRDRDIEAERLARQKELEEESVQLDREIEVVMQGSTSACIANSETYTCAELTEEERTSIVTAPEFLDFVEQSSKIVQRALNDKYDYIRDYTVGAEDGR